MKSYPTIPKNIQFSTDIYAFDKLDGSNIRAEWSNKRGFYKYGTRNRLLDSTERPYGLAIELINDEYGVELAKRFKDFRVQSGVAFFEFYGNNSFAGWHDESDDFDIVLFDVAPYKKGILGPVEFMKFTKGLRTPELVYRGKANNNFVNAVKEGTHPGVTYEGVVCKYKHKNQTRMFKIKSDAWLNKLKEKCNGDENLFNQLS